MTKRQDCRFIWYECAAADAVVAKDFYGRLFQWQTAEEAPMPGSTGRYTRFQLDGKDIAGLYPMSPQELQQVPSHWRIYVRVGDVDETVARAESLGGKSIASPQEVPGVGRMGFLEDPTGAQFALFQPKGHAGAAERGSRPGTFGWCELVTRDTQRAKSFYTELFHWGTKEDAQMGYTEWLIDGTSIGGVMELTERHGDAPPHWLAYVTVENCRTTAGGPQCTK